MKKDTIKEVVEKLNRNYLTEELFMPKKGRRLPERTAVIEIIRDLRQLFFRDILEKTARWNWIPPTMQDTGSTIFTMR